MVLAFLLSLDRGIARHRSKSRLTQLKSILQTLRCDPCAYNLTLSNSRDTLCAPNDCQEPAVNQTFPAVRRLNLCKVTAAISRRDMRWFSRSVP